MSSANTARIWDTESGKEVVALGNAGLVSRAAFSGDGKRVVTGSDGHFAVIWDAESGKQIAVLKHEHRAEFGRIMAAFSVDGTRVVTASQGDLACG
jgi:WD40 repeat protein